MARAGRRVLLWMFYCQGFLVEGQGLRTRRLDIFGGVADVGDFFPLLGWDFRRFVGRSLHDFCRGRIDLGVGRMSDYLVLWKSDAI